MKTKSKKKNKQAAKVPSRSAISNLGQEWLESEIDLSGNVHPNRLLKLLRGKKTAKPQSSLGWSLPPDVDEGKLARVNRWQNSLMQNKRISQVAEEIFTAVDAVLDTEMDDGDALTLLLACHAIRPIAGQCEFDRWQDFVSRLLDISRSTGDDLVSSPVRYMLLTVEIPLTIAFQIPEIEDYQQLAEFSCQRMATTISELLDHDGWPHARYLADYGPLVASWTRCQLMINELELEAGDESASQLEWVVRQLFRMLRPDRTMLFSKPGASPVAEEFLDRILDLSIDPEDKRLRKAISAAKGKAKLLYDSPVETSNLSEWSESAVLQSRWAPNSPKLAVDFSKNRCFVEICRDIVLIQGDAIPEVTINGVQHESNEPFDVACTESDEDIEYLELYKDLGNGVGLTRQFLLSRSEEVLMISDLVIPVAAARIDYRTKWPLAQGVEILHESETREIYLTSKSIQALVLPLALPEWKVGRTDDSLLAQDGALCLTQSSDGRGLFAPLFFDLNPKRSKKKRTWRQLTVGEQLEIVSDDVACAYRVQIDRLQWIFYRAISSIGNRTFMGENVNCEFTLSRFQKDGSTELLIEI